MAINMVRSEAETVLRVGVSEVNYLWRWSLGVVWVKTHFQTPTARSAGATSRDARLSRRRGSSRSLRGRSGRCGRCRGVVWSEGRCCSAGASCCRRRGARSRRVRRGGYSFWEGSILLLGESARAVCGGISEGGWCRWILWIPWMGLGEGLVWGIWCNTV